MDSVKRMWHDLLSWSVPRRSKSAGNENVRGHDGHDRFPANAETETWYDTETQIKRKLTYPDDDSGCPRMYNGSNSENQLFLSSGDPIERGVTTDTDMVTSRDTKKSRSRSGDTKLTHLQNHVQTDVTVPNVTSSAGIGVLEHNTVVVDGQK